MLQDYMNLELIWLHRNFPNQESLFKSMTEKLFEKGFVTNQYYDSLITREINFPTGLSMGDYFVAIPHGGCEEIRKEFIGVVVLSEPVNMRKMDAPTCEIPVEYVFFLGINSDEKHMDMLQEIIKMIKNRSLIIAMKEAASPEDILELLAAGNVYGVSSKV